MSFVVYRFLDSECKFASGQPWVGNAEQVERVVGCAPENGGIYRDAKGYTIRTWRVR